MKIRKIVIPVAGYGTRFLPFTKASPKEMIPIIDKPVIQIVIEEAVSAGIEEVILITSSNKRAIEDHFDYNFELEHRLAATGKEKELREVRRISDMAKFIYIRQKEQLGTGHAILQAEEAVGNESFAVLWGDDFIAANPPRLKQLIDVYNKKRKTIINVLEAESDQDLERYAVVKGNEVEKNLYKIEKIIEKPGAPNAPSRMISVGGFIFRPEIFSAIKDIKPGKGGEIWLTDAIDKMLKKDEVYAYKVQNAHYYDCGDKLEYLKAVVDFALKHKDFGKEFKKYLINLFNPNFKVQNAKYCYFEI